MKIQNRELKIVRLGVEESLWEDLYHRLLRLGWGRFFGFFLGVYLTLVGIFATAYYFLPGSIANIGPGDFVSCFAFSVQTLATIGYGYFYPQTLGGHLWVTLESAVSLFSTAVLTGLIFIKFSKPSSRILFSDKAIWTRHNGQDALIIRVGNVRTNRVFEGHAQLNLLKDEITPEGTMLRRVIDLKLVRDQTPIFALSWMLIHIIDAGSPLMGESPESLRQKGSELLVTFTGLDQDLSQTIVANTTYQAHHIVRARRFTDMIAVNNSVRTIDFSKIHQIEE